jgi:SMC interacting uncharacterized protein involved in chromosome segregation
MKLSEHARAVRDAIAAMDGELTKLDEVTDDREAIELALAEAREALDTTLKENEGTRQLFAREMLKLQQDLDMAKTESANELRRIGGLIEKAQAEYQTLQVETDSLLRKHDGILESIANIKKRFD